MRGFVQNDNHPRFTNGYLIEKEDFMMLINYQTVMRFWQKESNPLLQIRQPPQRTSKSWRCRPPGAASHNPQRPPRVQRSSRNPGPVHARPPARLPAHVRTLRSQNPPGNPHQTSQLTSKQCLPFSLSSLEVFALILWWEYKFLLKNVEMEKDSSWKFSPQKFSSDVFP